MLYARIVGVAGQAVFQVDRGEPCRDIFVYRQEGYHNARERTARHQSGGKQAAFAQVGVFGFLAFAFSTLPPIRQFGMLSSVAFVLSMIADFTALPASLWLLYRSKPDSLMTDAQPALPAPPSDKP